MPATVIVAAPRRPLDGRLLEDARALPARPVHIHRAQRTV
jgi:hypothetical protein